MVERKRKNKLTVYLNDAELDYLEQRCGENNESKSQIIRELIVFGFNYKVDYNRLSITGSMNQGSCCLRLRREI